jgi:transcriptional regulator with XRE-family HTH domain
MTITAAQSKAARRRLGWSQTQLAAEAHVSPTTVSHYEATAGLARDCLSNPARH